LSATARMLPMRCARSLLRGNEYCLRGTRRVSALSSCARAEVGNPQENSFWVSAAVSRAGSTCLLRESVSGWVQACGIPCDKGSCCGHWRKNKPGAHPLLRLVMPQFESPHSWRRLRQSRRAVPTSPKPMVTMVPGSGIIARVKLAETEEPF